MVGIEVLPPAFATFREAHPRIDVELVVSNRSSDLLRREADIAVRMVKPTQNLLITRKLGTLTVGLHATPRYLQMHGTPRSFAALAEHPLIGFDSVSSVRDLPKTPFPVTRDIFAFRCDSDIGQYAQLKAGFGLGFCQHALGKREGLIPLLKGELGFDMGVWLVMHQDLKSSRRVRLLFEHLATYLKGYIASAT